MVHASASYLSRSLVHLLCCFHSFRDTEGHDTWWHVHPKVSHTFCALVLMNVQESSRHGWVWPRGRSALGEGSCPARKSRYALSSCKHRRRPSASSSLPVFFLFCAFSSFSPFSPSSPFLTRYFCMDPNLLFRKEYPNENQREIGW